MSKQFRRFLLLYGCLLQPGADAVVSVVFNMRIAELTRRGALSADGDNESRSSLAGIPFLHYRERRIGLKAHAGGSLAIFLHEREKTYVQIATALGHVSESILGFQREATQMDDLLISFGQRFVLPANCRVTLSGHVASPLHKDTALIKPQFGIGHPALGGQVDVGWTYDPENDRTFFGAVRVLHFFPGNTPGVPGPVRTFPGDLIDIYLAHHLNWGPHGFEWGYNPSFLLHSYIVPPIPQQTVALNLKRSTLYANYQYHFAFSKSHPGMIATGLSYGFDHVPELLGNRYLVTAWMSLGVQF